MERDRRWAVGHVLGFAHHDDRPGARTQLYAGGAVQVPGASSQSFVARWDGSAWQGVGQAGWIVRAIAGFDDGSGRALYATTNSSGMPALNRIVRWNGSAWTPLGFALEPDEIPTAFAVFDSGSGPALHVGSYQGTLCARVGFAWTL